MLPFECARRKLSAPNQQSKQRRQAETLNCITKVIIERRGAVQETHRG
jgi:hypothetical protein